MAFVFGLLLITGAVFIVVDSVTRERFGEMRLERLVRPMINNSENFGMVPPLPPFQRDLIRIIDVEGTVLYGGTFYESIPFEATEGIREIENGEETYHLLTAAVSRDGQLIGYVQIADRAIPNNLLSRLLLFFLISGGISGLTFGVGLFFARRSLKPAQHMMERLEQFTQDASHELRTPLTAVSTSLDMALMMDDNKQYVLTAKNDLKEIVILVERLLELARLDKLALQTEQVSLQAIIEDSIEKHRSFLEERKISVETDFEPVVMNGDHTLLRQVVGNLLTNAIKFNKSNGNISIRLTSDALIIQDTGKGISKEALPHVFDRFYQEDTSRTKPAEGVGLGLALVKRIIELHGWTIDVASQEGKGTLFTVHFR